MKNIHPTFVFVFFISLLFCNVDEKYSFISGGSQRLDVGEKWTFWNTHETSFTIPKIGFVKYSGRYVDRMEAVALEGEFWKFKATLTDIESDSYVNGIEILDQYREAMENNSCYLYVKSSGYDDEVHHIEPVKEEDYYLQEAFEAAHMSISPKHFRFPFGIGGVDVSVGDKWTTDYDSLKFYVNMGSPSSNLSSKSTKTLKKVREKKGRKIAYIEVEELLTLELRVAVNILGEKRFMVGHATGTVDGSYKWDLDSDDLLQSHVNINLVGEYLGENSLAHNVHVKGDFVYISHYTTGLKILDIFDPTNPIEVAAYDTYPDNDNDGFYGCWGTYPFTMNNYIYASDMQYGLFVFKFDHIQAGWVYGTITDGGQPVGGVAIKSLLNGTNRTLPRLE